LHTLDKNRDTSESTVELAPTDGIATNGRVMYYDSSCIEFQNHHEVIVFPMRDKGGAFIGKLLWVYTNGEMVDTCRRKHC